MTANPRISRVPSLGTNACALPREGSSAPTLYAQLYRRLRGQILTGVLRPGSRLPSSRALAIDLGLSRNTIEAAFQQLVDEGFVERRIGSGSTVTKSLADAAPFPAPRTAGHPTPANPLPSPSPRLPRRGAQLVALGRAELDSDRFTGSWATNAEGFPWQVWNRLVAREARRVGRSLLDPIQLLGLEVLRNQIAEHATLSRGITCTPRQVVIVNSTQQAIDLAARLLLDPGQTVLVEDPGYPSARAAFAAAGARVRPVAVDEKGIVIEALARHRSARLLYTTPSHQFPLGVMMSLDRRVGALRWANTQEAWILEDDYDSEFRHDGRPLAAMQALDSTQRVLYLGTFNKVLFPGLRLAYLIVPDGLVDAFAALRRITDGPVSPLLQSVLAEFMARGQFATYLRQARIHYAHCRDLLVAAIERCWPSVSLGPISTGLHLVVHLPKSADDVTLVARAARSEIGLAPLSRYYLGPKKNRGLLLSYGTANPKRIAQIVERMTPLIEVATRAGSR